MSRCLGEELVIDKKFQKNSERLKMDEMVTDAGDRKESLQRERLRGTTKHTVKLYHDKDKEKILKGFFREKVDRVWRGIDHS